MTDTEPPVEQPTYVGEISIVRVTQGGERRNTSDMTSIRVNATNPGDLIAQMAAHIQVLGANAPVRWVSGLPGEQR